MVRLRSQIGVMIASVTPAWYLTRVGFKIVELNLTSKVKVNCPQTKRNITKQVCIFCPNLVVLAWMSGELWLGQAQNWVNLEFQVKFHHEGLSSGWWVIAWTSSWLTDTLDKQTHAGDDNIQRPRVRMTFPLTVQNPGKAYNENELMPQQQYIGIKLHIWQSFCEWELVGPDPTWVISTVACHIAGSFYKHCLQLFLTVLYNTVSSLRAISI